VYLLCVSHGAGVMHVHCDNTYFDAAPTSSFDESSVKCVTHFDDVDLHKVHIPVMCVTEMKLYASRINADKHIIGGMYSLV